VGCCIIVPLADGASSVQAVDDSVAPAILLCGIVPLGNDVVGASTEWLEFVNGCLWALTSSQFRREWEKGNGSTTYQTLDTELGAIPQSHTDSGPWNCMTGNSEGLSIKAATHEERRGLYPFPSRHAFSKGGLYGWQETEKIDSQEDAGESGVICRELHDAERR
jgi:hypothetical protein